MATELGQTHLLPTVGARKPREVIQRREGLEPRNTPKGGTSRTLGSCPWAGGRPASPIKQPACNRMLITLLVGRVPSRGGVAGAIRRRTLGRMDSLALLAGFRSVS